jgi:putative glutathione S-transferase
MQRIAQTVNFDHIVRHYHYSHESINPHRIIPTNPVLDYWAPHSRDTLGTLAA